MAFISTIIAIAISIAVSVALNVVVSLLTPRPQQRQVQQQQTQQPAVPTAADGKYNLKQNVPSLVVILGRVKKGGDYAFLEEKAGIAYHIIVAAAHRVHAFVQHYLHDEIVTLDGNVVDVPTHFARKVTIETQLGLNAETAKWTDIFPTIWDAAHRGDGLAKVFMTVATVGQDSFQNVYPQQMPVHTAIIEGALLYDPREEGHDPDDPSTWSFSTNLALMRLAHLTNPWGGKLSFADMYLPEWAAAADVCDQTVTNRSAGEEPRYHGGLWFRHDGDPVEIGHTIDEAGELVIYERADGLIGVHPGVYTAPDIRITENEILSFTYLANRSAAATVLAVRGRFTDPSQVYNTVDAAIWGDPYDTDDTSQRTKTIDNAAVQSHNHMQRLQKLAYIRANAPRVSLKIPYLPQDTSRFVAYRRFVTVHYPSRGLDEATLEVIGRPKLDLKELTISFDGIVVPATLFDFDAATEEGEPSGAGAALAGSGVPVPTGFDVELAVEILSGGQTTVYAVGSWDHLSDALTYEFQYQLADASEPPRSVLTHGGEVSARTATLMDGGEYRFRVRTNSNGAFSDWTDYVDKTATADAVAPAPPSGLFAAYNADSGQVEFIWNNPNSANLHASIVYIGTGAFGGASPIGTVYGAPSASMFFAATVSSGSYHSWVTSANASGVQSAATGPSDFTVP